MSGNVKSTLNPTRDSDTLEVTTVKYLFVFVLQANNLLNTKVNSIELTFSSKIIISCRKQMKAGIPLDKNSSSTETPVHLK